MITINNNTTDSNYSKQLESPLTAIRVGQLWRDGHVHRECNSEPKHRLVMVVDTRGDKIKCVGLSNNKISVVRRQQFNRGKTGFHYVSDMRPYLNAAFVIGKGARCNNGCN